MTESHPSGLGYPITESPPSTAVTGIPLSTEEDAQESVTSNLEVAKKLDGSGSPEGRIFFEIMNSIEDSNVDTDEILWFFRELEHIAHANISNYFRVRRISTLTSDLLEHALLPLAQSLKTSKDLLSEKESVFQAEIADLTDEVAKYRTMVEVIEASAIDADRLKRDLDESQERERNLAENYQKQLADLRRSFEKSPQREKIYFASNRQKEKEKESGDLRQALKLKEKEVNELRRSLQKSEQNGKIMADRNRLKEKELGELRQSHRKLQVREKELDDVRRILQKYQQREKVFSYRSRQQEKELSDLRQSVRIEQPKYKEVVRRGAREG